MIRENIMFLISEYKGTSTDKFLTAMINTFFWNFFISVAVNDENSGAQPAADGDKQPPEKALRKREDADSLQDEEANLEVNARW